MWTVGARCPDSSGGRRLQQAGPGGRRDPRPGPELDTTAGRIRQRAAKAADGCADPLPGPPGDLTLAVQCIRRLGGTFFDVRTTLAAPTGFVSALVSVQPTAKPSGALQTRVRTISRDAAGAALQML